MARKVKSKDGALQQEANLQSAIGAYRNGEFKSKAKAAHAFGVKYGTMCHRMKGRIARASNHSNNHKLKSFDELAFRIWVKNRDIQGNPVRIKEAEGMVQRILAFRKSPPQPISRDWMQQFVKRCPEFTKSIAKGYICERRQGEEVEAIESWLKRFKQSIKEHEIRKGNVYSLSISGLYSNEIKDALPNNRSKLIRIDHDERLTFLECVNDSGAALKPFLLIKGLSLAKNLDKEVTRQWHVIDNVSCTDNNQIFENWIQEVFNPLTDKQPGVYRALIIYERSVTASQALDRFCHEEQILLITLPRNSSYLFPSLDMSQSGQLKTFYDIQDKTGLNLESQSSQTKLLEDYLIARAKDLSSKRIKLKFTSSGLWPFKLDIILPNIKAIDRNAEEADASDGQDEMDELGDLEEHDHQISVGIMDVIEVDNLSDENESSELSDLSQLSAAVYMNQ